MEQLDTVRNLCKKRKYQINEKYIFADFSDFSEITEAVRKSNATKIFTGGVRINKSMYRTQDETDKYITKSLKRKLP